MERYYLVKNRANMGTWVIKRQQFIDDEWVDLEVYGVFPTWEVATSQPVSPIAFDPQEDWPEELGGQS